LAPSFLFETRNRVGAEERNEGGARAEWRGKGVVVCCQFRLSAREEKKLDVVGAFKAKAAAFRTCAVV